MIFYFCVIPATPAPSFPKFHQNFFENFLKGKNSLDEKTLNNYPIELLQKFAENKLSATFGKKPLKKTIMKNILEKEKKETLILFKKFILDHFSDSELLSLKNLKRNAAFCGIQGLSEEEDKEAICQNINNYIRIQELNISPQDKFLLNCYIFARFFGCIPEFYDRAIRMKNWNLRWATLKNSLKLFNRKPK